MADKESFWHNVNRRTDEKHRLEDVEHQNQRDRAAGSGARGLASARRTAPPDLNAREKLFWYRHEILDEIRKCRDLDRRFKDDWSTRLNAIDMFVAGADDRLWAFASAVRRAADEEERSYLRRTSESSSGLLGATMSRIAGMIEKLALQSADLLKSGG